MDELKSAWEIAQERAGRLGKLSTEEREQQERQRYGQVGQALAHKWLDSSGQLDVTWELNKYGEPERDRIKKSLIDHLVEAIGFTTTQAISGTRRIIEAIGRLEPGLQPGMSEMAGLVQEYEAGEQKIRQELESGCRETLHKLRISGTAVGAINVEASPEWQLAKQELLEALTPRLNDLKRTLTG